MARLHSLIVAKLCFAFCILACVTVALPSTAHAEISKAHYQKSANAINKAFKFLRSTQEKDGSWSPKSGPAVTAMIAGAMLDQNDITRDDPAVRKAISYILSQVQKDGSIHSGILANYNTSICLSTLARLSDDPKVKKAIDGGRIYLKKIQYQGGRDEQGNLIDENHAFWGGSGYGKHGRPDGSNTQFAIEAFIETGSDCKDPEVLRAVNFFSRLQGSDTNKANGSKIQSNGGAIYATSINKDKVGQPQSQAGEVTINGKTVLRTYGSMTFAMFKTYLLAQIHNEKFQRGPEDKKRIADVMKWVKHNYTVEYNPGMPTDRKHQGYFYYFATMGKALKLYQHATIETADGKKHNWGEEMIDKIVSLQRKDGSWLNEADRWLEGDPNLVSAYALIAISSAR